MIPYSRLLEELDIATLADLEKLIIDSLYKDIFVGKMGTFHCPFSPQKVDDFH